MIAKQYKIKMLHNCIGAPDGINVQPYKKGVVYTVNEQLKKAFVNHSNNAELIETIENKAIVPEYENKSAIEQNKKNAEKLVESGQINKDNNDPEPKSIFEYVENKS